MVNPKPNWPKWKCNWVFQNVSTPGQYNILDKNLNFCQTPYYYNNKKLLKDNMCIFHKKITLKSVFILRTYFWKQIRRPRTTYKQLIWLGTKKKKKAKHHTMQKFIESVNTDVDKTYSEEKKLSINNLNNLIVAKKAIEHFSKITTS